MEIEELDEVHDFEHIGEALTDYIAAPEKVSVLPLSFFMLHDGSQLRQIATIKGLVRSLANGHGADVLDRYGALNSSAELGFYTRTKDLGNFRPEVLQAWFAKHRDGKSNGVVLKGNWSDQPVRRVWLDKREAELRGIMGGLIR